jgi:hypothetical protein
MKFCLRKSEERCYSILKKSITLDLKDILPFLLNDLHVNLSFTDDEISNIKSASELKGWISFKQRQKMYDNMGLTGEQRKNMEFESWISDNEEDASYSKEERMEKRMAETTFNFPGLFKDFFPNKTLFEWLSLGRKSIMIGNISLEEILNSSETLVEKEAHNECWIEMLDCEGSLVKDSKDITTIDGS